MPLNRIIAWFGPYISVGSGAFAAWLLTKLHFLALFHVTHDSLASFIGQLVVFGLTAGLTWLGHSKWLKGHQIWLEGMLRAFEAGKLTRHEADTALGVRGVIRR